MQLLQRSNLRQLIVTLALLSSVVTFINMFVASAKVQKQALIENTLLSNEAYAFKLANSIQFFLESTQFELAYSANQSARYWHDPQWLQNEVDRLFQQDNAFNSVLISDANGILIAASNNIKSLIGLQPNTPGSKQALQLRRALVSHPYFSASNNLIVLLTQPIIRPDGTYLGYIGRTIYLKENNILNRLLGEHNQLDDTHTYVVDQQRRLLYHPDPERIGSIINTNLTNLALSGGTGYAPAINSQGVEMLSGYSYVPTAGWGLVSQRPTQVILKAHEGLMLKALLNSLPINIAMLLLIWLCSWLISSPLRQLTHEARDIKEQDTIEQVKQIKAWYFEAHELKNAFLLGLKNVHEYVGKLNEDARTDPLTGLSNRRALERILSNPDVIQDSFAAITLDIDHFKHVNDTYGHDVGDVVLQELALLMRSNSRDNDFCIRLGGEEFLILLPGCPLKTATEIAERLRLAVAFHPFTTAGQLTISLGVAIWPLHASNPATVLKIADEMLYAAKQGGRNQVQVAPVLKLN